MGGDSAIAGYGTSIGISDTRTYPRTRRLLSLVSRRCLLATERDGRRVPMTTFRQLLDQFDASAKTLTAKGRRFEDFCEAFFKAGLAAGYDFDQVWSWDDWPGRDDRSDTGIDLVARERGSGNLVAIQCKFYSPQATLSWPNVATFVGMLGQPQFAAGLIVSTAGAESSNLHSNIQRHEKPIHVWRVEDFEESSVDWDQFRIDRPMQLALHAPKRLRPHQEQALADVVHGFEAHARGQMLMACGTGKTFSTLSIAERLAGKGGSILYLVPSINLLSQTVKAWAVDASIPLASFAVCSDIHAGRRGKGEDMRPNDLAFPASTDAAALIERVRERSDPAAMTVVFSTYQSIDVITKAQEQGLADFDLVICDEAHRTTGSFNDAGDQSTFTRVHEDAYVRARRRLYMTATARVYGDQSKAKAAEHDVVLASMDDESTYGPVFHELGFGEAVRQHLLTDYRVIILAVNEDAVSAAFQRQFVNDDTGLALNDAARIVGCWHALSKRGPQFAGDAAAMQRAVAFSTTIKASKAFTEAFPQIANEALEVRRDANAVRIETSHVDGTNNVKVRSEAIAWLEEPPGQGVCRVLSNAKCLTEGVDVPALDAVMFLQPRKSIVDVVQAVGRVMRLAPGKDYGYVILPVAVPSGVEPAAALRDNKAYQVVWQVLQALRSHDERLAAEINKIDINGTSRMVQVIGVGLAGGDDPADPGVTTQSVELETTQLPLPDLGEWRDALYARIVERVGDRRYMEHWAEDISQIASAQQSRIRGLLDHPDQNPQAVARFDAFLTALQHNLNDGVTRDDAVAMLSQHLITRPVFEALFGDGQFSGQNPVSRVMQEMLDELDAGGISAETETLEGFYEHIRSLVGGIDTAEGRQQVITGLYGQFFKKALPDAVDALGIVYTPIEIVDFINRSVNDLLIRHFDGATLSDEGVHVLDPFTGTGTFIARLIETGLIAPDALERKYASELHANEIMLFAYYIAAMNIENAYQGMQPVAEYQPFEGIVLADTFQMSEAGDPMDSVFFPRNNDRADRQRGLDIRVIVSNPPYSSGQNSQNDDNANMTYPTLDTSIRSTYAERSKAVLKNSLYDSYVRAIRWASNRLADSPAGGVIGYVTNGGWLDGNAAAGIRDTLTREFHHIYVYNLRGNTRTSGELSRREGGQTFGPGSRATVAIMLLVKQPGAVPEGGGAISYHDIGDYLDRDAKLAAVAVASIEDLPWQRIEPNEHHDWLNQRDKRYDQLVPLAGEPGAIFHIGSNGLVTRRDAWVYNSSEHALRCGVEAMVAFYNEQVRGFVGTPAGQTGTTKQRATQAEAFVDKDPTRFSWVLADYHRIANGQTYEIRDDMIRRSLYRPFFKQAVAFDRTLNSSTTRLPSLYPTPKSTNVGISVVGTGTTVPFGCLASDGVPQLHLIGASSATTHYARWRYQDAPATPTLLDTAPAGRVSNLNPEAVARFQAALGDDLTDDDVFYYVYGILHSPGFRSTFESSLKKEKPRVPLVGTRSLFDAFADAGRELCDLHVGYETVEPYPLTEEWADGADPAANPDLLLVGTSKMRYAKAAVPDTGHGKRDLDRSRLRYNAHLTLSSIPPAAHEYVLGTRSGIDWIIDRYYIKTDKASGIVNDANQWGIERGDPRYIVDLIKRVVTVSVRTVEIVAGLPSLEETIAGLGE